MDLEFLGANCVVINTKDARIVIDDNLKELGAKSVLKSGDIALFTTSHGLVSSDLKLLIDSPGEYEVSNISITGIQLQSHIDEPGQKNAVGFKIITNDINIFVSGHISPNFSDTDIEKIGMVDVLVVPVGGNGFTLDPVGALKVIKEIEPKVVIPTHYDNGILQYTVPQQELAQALHGIGMEPQEHIGKLRLKSADLSDVMQLVVLK